MAFRLCLSIVVLQHALATKTSEDIRSTVVEKRQSCSKTRGSTFIQKVRHLKGEAATGSRTLPADDPETEGEVVMGSANGTNGTNGTNGSDWWWPWYPWTPTTTTSPTQVSTYQGRKLHIINSCKRPMIMHSTGGNSELPCGSGCPSGMTCSPYTWSCYFDMPEPSTGWTIPAGATAELYTPNAPIRQGNGVIADWSGKLEFYPDAIMDLGLPASALCNGQAKCPTYQGLNGVATAVEFTFVPHGADFYDVSIINGFNIGIEMKPDGSFRPVYEGLYASNRGYNCGAAGASAQPDERLTPCSWAFPKRLMALGHDDISPLVTQVEGGYGFCQRQADCSPLGLVCGQVAKTVWDYVAQVYRPTTQITMECGHRIGMWSVYQLCVWSGNSYRSPAPYEGLIDCPSMHDMFACAGPAPWTTSCYNEVPNDGECCGCANWTEVLGVPVPEGGKGCQGASPRWTQTAQPFYELLKAGCPTSYTFAFDDETSTFTCRTAESQHDASIPNKAGYNITLCPTEPDFVEMDGGTDKVCRGQASWDNNNAYFVLWPAQTLSQCKERCRMTEGCKGIEYHQSGRCEVWTRPAGIQSTKDFSGYTCLRHVPYEFETVGTGKDEACRGLAADDNSQWYYRLYLNETFSSCQRRCREASDVCKGIEVGPNGRCEVWTHVGGIHATTPVAHHSCHVFVPSDFENVGGSNQACRGSSSTDNKDSYYIHKRDQTLPSCKDLCRSMGSRCKGIEFGPFGRCELWTRSEGIQSSRRVDGFSCYRYAPV
mmetsp:Transcript_32141/g.74041  ORF Transcript_32141/g.74041 Transcript_32141/m.74041 type:complete len:769 (-) Transcript_32141:155-2461(-)